MYTIDVICWLLVCVPALIALIVDGILILKYKWTEDFQSRSVSRRILRLCRMYPVIPLLYGMALGHLLIPQHPLPGEV